MSESHFQIFSGKTSQGIELELVITGSTPVKAAMAAGYVMSGAAVYEDDVCVCIEQGDDGESCGICSEIYDGYSDRYFYPDICPVHQFDEYSSSNVIFAAWYESLTSFYMQHQLVFSDAVVYGQGNSASLWMIFGGCMEQDTLFIMYMRRES